jgi:hypothetical protein
LRKVSAQRREYSHFRETGAGDLVRSRLPPEVGSAKKARVNSGVIRLGGAYSAHSTGNLCPDASSRHGKGGGRTEAYVRQPLANLRSPIFDTIVFRRGEVLASL